jgi:flagella basal body P-ring formation protein FlgA
MCVCGVAGPAMGQVVRLREHVSVEKGANVRLGEMATVSGGAAGERLANIVVVSGVAGPLKVKAEAVLMAVIAQQGAAASTELELSGAAVCDIQLAGAKAAAAEMPAAVAEQVKPAAAAPAAKPVVVEAAKTADVSSGLSLAEVVTARVLKELEAGKDDVRVTIETVNPLVNRPAGVGREWLVRPLTRSFLGTVQCEAQLVEGEKIVQRLTVSAHVEKKARLAIAARPLGRGEVVTDEGVKEEEVWLDRAAPTVFTAEADVVGLEARVPVAAGQRLDQRDFKATELAAKGDDLRVIFMTGSLKVEGRGKAMEGGTMNSQIQVKNERTNETFQATLVGKRMAVVGGTNLETDKRSQEMTR